MISRLRKTGLLWPGVATLLAFGILVALGNWQWQRMHWKQGLLVSLKQAATAEPADMPVVPSAAMIGSLAELEAIQFRRVRISGTFDHDHQMHVWAPGPRGPAWIVVTPLRIEQDESTSRTAHIQATHLLVIRGIVPAAQKDSGRRRAGEVGGQQTLAGRIRLDQPNKWANEPNIKKNEWFTRDLAAMTDYFQRASKATIRMAPFFLEAEPSGRDVGPKPDLKSLNLSNRHLEYALTWWGLAATLLGVFAVFAIGRLKTAAS